MKLNMTICLLLLAPLFMQTPIQALQVEGTATPQSCPKIETALNLTQLSIMGLLGDGGEAYDIYDLSYAEGKYSQIAGEKNAAGKILDLGALQRPDGSIYPIFVAEGTFFFQQKGENPAGGEKIEKITGLQDLALAPKETVWTTADGKSSLHMAEGNFFIVLERRNFPEHIQVIGIADSKTLYLYEAE